MQLFESCSTDGMNASRTDIRRALMRTQWFTSLNPLKVVETLIQRMCEEKAKGNITKATFLRVMENRFLRSNGTSWFHTHTHTHTHTHNNDPKTQSCTHSNDVGVSKILCHTYILPVGRGGDTE